MKNGRELPFFCRFLAIFGRLHKGGKIFHIRKQRFIIKKTLKNRTFFSLAEKCL